MCQSFQTKMIVIIGRINLTNKRGETESERARAIAKTLGYFTAARYLALRGWSLEAALFTLLGK